MLLTSYMLQNSLIVKSQANRTEIIIRWVYKSKNMGLNSQHYRTFLSIIFEDGIVN